MPIGERAETSNGNGWLWAFGALTFLGMLAVLPSIIPTEESGSEAETGDEEDTDQSAHWSEDEAPSIQDGDSITYMQTPDNEMEEERTETLVSIDDPYYLEPADMFFRVMDSLRDL